MKKNNFNEIDDLLTKQIESIKNIKILQALFENLEKLNTDFKTDFGLYVSRLDSLTSLSGIILSAVILITLTIFDKKEILHGFFFFLYLGGLSLVFLSFVFLLINQKIRKGYRHITSYNLLKLGSQCSEELLFLKSRIKIMSFNIQENNNLLESTKKLSKNITLILMAGIFCLVISGSYLSITSKNRKAVYELAPIETTISNIEELSNNDEIKILDKRIRELTEKVEELEQIYAKGVQ